ncbi:MAG: class I SAM-dependent DNA methyltransferase, partial [Planctomycetota bacterium]|nr:class I SAM-dependent DNA methyltransferase [Planctomycetota bacterium]
DAVLAWDSIEPAFDDAGEPITRWDGRTTKAHPVTGEEVPDDTARVQESRYIKSGKAEWPKADFIVGNPPFIGNKRMRFHLGDGYVDAIRRTWSDVPESADYVMYWWQMAARAVAPATPPAVVTAAVPGMVPDAAPAAAKRFGLITTNSISQSFNRRIIENAISDKLVRLVFAIDDHPWVDAELGAAVRISMTVGAGAQTADIPVFGRVINERPVVDADTVVRTFDILFRSVASINADLTSGVDVTDVRQLTANSNLSNQGVTPLGTGFRVFPETLQELEISPDRLPHVLRPYLIGRDIVQRNEPKFIIDFFGLSAAEAREQYPALFQRVLSRVKPERDQKKRPAYRDKWWIFAEPRTRLRPALKGLRRYIATCRTARHRVFVFVGGPVIPDAKIVAIALDDAFFLGTLSSKCHVVWAMRSGAWLGVGNDSNYNHSDCFARFPFPDPNEATKQRIRDLGEQLEAHRKQRQMQYAELTITGIYNVLEKLRAGEPLTTTERQIHEQGLVSVLRQIHDDLDAAVFDAYGWPHGLSDEQILECLVALNHVRADEEQRGLIRWLRPDFQKPQGPVATQQELEIEDEEPVAPATAAAKEPWPNTLRDQVRAIRETLAKLATPATSDDIANRFTRAPKATVAELLATLADVGQARQTEDGRYVA